MRDLKLNQTNEKKTNMRAMSFLRKPFSLSWLNNRRLAAAPAAAALIVAAAGTLPAQPEEGAAGGGEAYDVNAVVVTGDRVPVYELDEFEDWENEALYAPMTQGDVEAFRQKVLKALQDAGHLFATVSVYKQSLNLGFLKLRVHVGEKGEVTVSGNRWHTDEQVTKRVDWDKGAHFNYNDLHEDLYELNLKPRVNVDTELKPRTDAKGKRIVDVNLAVEDRFPVHAAWSMSNTGTKETGDWRSRLSVQLENLVLQEETLTFDWITDPHDTNDINAYSGGLHLPLGDVYGLSVFGGVSETDLDDIFEGLDIYGDGAFYGMQLERNLCENDEKTLDLSAGLLFQKTKTLAMFMDQGVWGDEIRLGMPRVTLSYAAKKYDEFGGRNFGSLTYMTNSSGRLGASSEEDYMSREGESMGVDGNFTIVRAQCARFQKIAASDDFLGNSTLFFRLDSQWTSDNLPAAMMKRVGGFGTVRGHPEYFSEGDIGVNATLEYSTPIWANFIPYMERDEAYLKEHPEDWRMHRVRAIAFADYGYVAYNNFQEREILKASGVRKDKELAAMGVGLRAGLTPYSQLKLDWGIPLNNVKNYETGDSDGDRDGRLHFSFQLQY